MEKPYFLCLFCAKWRTMQNKGHKGKKNSEEGCIDLTKQIDADDEILLENVCAVQWRLGSKKKYIQRGRVISSVSIRHIISNMGVYLQYCRGYSAQ